MVLSELARRLESDTSGRIIVRRGEGPRGGLRRGREEECLSLCKTLAGFRGAKDVAIIVGLWFVGELIVASGLRPLRTRFLDEGEEREDVIVMLLESADKAYGWEIRRTGVTSCGIDPDCEAGPGLFWKLGGGIFGEGVAKASSCVCLGAKGKGYSGATRLDSTNLRVEFPEKGRVETSEILRLVDGREKRRRTEPAREVIYASEGRFGRRSERDFLCVVTCRIPHGARMSPKVDLDENCDERFPNQCTVESSSIELFGVVGNLFSR